MGAGLKSLVLFAPVVSSFLVYVKATRLQVQGEKPQLLVSGGEKNDVQCFCEMVLRTVSYMHPSFGGLRALLPAVAESSYPVVGAIVQMCYELIGSVQTGTVTAATMQEKIRVLQAEGLGCGDKALLQAIVNAFWAVC